MASIRISEPGTEFGPCADESCQHTDCAASRRQAETICRFCNEPIGYDRFFCEDDLGHLAHERCLVEKIEKERK